MNGQQPKPMLKTVTIYGLMSGLQEIPGPYLRDRNHPSVIMWSIGNEVPDLDTEVGKKNAKMLSDICREMDPTRPVNAGVHLSTAFDKELEKYFDVFGIELLQDRYDLILTVNFQNSLY